MKAEIVTTKELEQTKNFNWIVVECNHAAFGRITFIDALPIGVLPSSNWEDDSLTHYNFYPLQ